MRRKKYKSKAKFLRNSKELRKRTKKIMKNLKRPRKQFMKLTCNRCKRTYKIRVNDKKIYTKEIIKNYICLLCKH